MRRLEPMLPLACEGPFDVRDYLFEPMIDGQRLLLSMVNGVARLYTRHGFEVTASYPELLRVPIRDGSDVLLDGEIVCYDSETGEFDCEGVLERYRLTKPMDIRLAAVRKPVHYFVFDVLRYEGRDLRAFPLLERKALLEAALDDNRCYSRMPWIEDAGRSPFNAVRSRELGVEGVVAKRKGGRYAAGRSGDWLTIRQYRYTNATIVGYRKNQFGWLLREEGRDAGIVERLVPGVSASAFERELMPAVTGEDRNYVYVEPTVEAQIRYRSRTKDGLLRRPEFAAFVV